jgi:hypothetical protein
VTFTPAAGFTFSCCNVEMSEGDIIVFVRHDTKSDWRFVNANGLDKSPFRCELEDDGRVLIVTNDHSKTGPFPYTITITDNGTRYTSKTECDRTHPPMIMNL